MRNLVLVNKDAYQRETLAEWPVRLPLRSNQLVRLDFALEEGLWKIFKIISSLLQLHSSTLRRSKESSCLLCCSIMGYLNPTPKGHYTTTRKVLFVMVDENISDPFEVSTGVLQDDVLVHFLFIILILFTEEGYIRPWFGSGNSSSPLKTLFTILGHRPSWLV